MRRLHIVTAIALASALPVTSGCNRKSAKTPASSGAAPATQSASSSRPPSSSPPGAVDEVLANIRQQPVGDHRLADYDLPEPFLRRIADRIIRDSFQDQFHTVYDDGAGGGFPPPMPPPRDETRGARLVAIVAAERAVDLVAQRHAQFEARPPRRGYRPDEAWTASATGAAIVAQRLARDGLLSTLAQVLEHDDAGAIGSDDTAVLEWLRGTGLPVDLLDHFALSANRPPGPAIDIVRHVAGRIQAGRTAASLADELAALRFAFTPTHPGFHVSSESGEHPIGLMRLQLTRGGYWRTLGEGGSLDVLRQLIERLPDVSFVASVENQFVEDLVPLAGAWPLGEAGRLTLVAEPLTVAQWAQDNGKAGVVSPGWQWATIVPRYASRRDDGSVFIPGESSLVDGLAAVGQVLVRSPLLFQGGNLLAVRHPVSAERTLLMGEAEICRNTALGLTPEQVKAAFRAEFAVDRCVVLPPVSFHIDYDVSVRAMGDEMVAFVNDPVAAARAIIRCGVDALQNFEDDWDPPLPAGSFATVRGHLAAGRDRELAESVAKLLARYRAPDGGFPLSLARAFSLSAADSPVGNLQRFLVAIDVLMSATLGDDELPPPGPGRSYVDAIRRLDAQRLALHDALRELGWTVVPVPSLAAGDRSINSINGIHDRTRYLMPAYGGLYAPVDDAAREVFESRLGPAVEVIPIFCAESQRRSGAVHCAVAAYPAR